MHLERSLNRPGLYPFNPGHLLYPAMPFKFRFCRNQLITTTYFPELLDWPYLWQQQEYVMREGATSFMFLVLAADQLPAR